MCDMICINAIKYFEYSFLQYYTNQSIFNVNNKHLFSNTLITQNNI